ncbi:unnamed protein product [Pieris macdunnoughi]|uniref:Uncharacterized protein n=1 Tax=Pieris macdunnoughi TaxID=345717 RepID=A0A821SZF7_9NEOP|nr:unnamed protein product [Pieris macdunnoughi]
MFRTIIALIWSERVGRPRLLLPSLLLVSLDYPGSPGNMDQVDELDENGLVGFAVHSSRNILQHTFGTPLSIDQDSDPNRNMDGKLTIK